MSRLGTKVYFVDMVAKRVSYGCVLSEIISKSGYKCSIIIDDNRINHSIEDELIFLDEESAKGKLENSLPIQEQMKEYEKEHNSLMNHLREQVIGKPKFKELANEYIGGK